MKRYIIPLLLLCFLLAGCSVVVDDAGTLKEHFFTPTEETEDDAYINAAPANDEQGWGPLTPRP